MPPSPVPDAPLVLLLDQNVSREVVSSAASIWPECQVVHASELGMSRATDSVIVAWALANRAVVVTYDEDFADQRQFPAGSHGGVVRLRVWPTTVERTIEALSRLATEFDSQALINALVIVDNGSIRRRER